MELVQAYKKKSIQMARIWLMNQQEEVVQMAHDGLRQFRKHDNFPGYMSASFWIPEEVFHLLSSVDSEMNDWQKRPKMLILTRGNGEEEAYEIRSGYTGKLIESTGKRGRGLDIICKKVEDDE